MPGRQGIGGIDDLLRDLYAKGKIKPPKDKKKASVELPAITERYVPPLAVPAGPDWQVEALILRIIRLRCACGQEYEYPAGTFVRYRCRKDRTLIMDTTRPQTVLPLDLPKDVEVYDESCKTCGGCFHITDNATIMHTHFERKLETNVDLVKVNTSAERSNPLDAFHF
jgi:hypothetical protein